MIERRDFLKGSMVAASALALGLGGKAFAGQECTFSGVIYTKDNAGMWKDKVKSHAPDVNVKGAMVSIVTHHPMSEEHYIVRHTLVLADGKVVGGTTFKPTDQPESSYELPAGYKGTVYATSSCNRHDFWLTELTV